MQAQLSAKGLGCLETPEFFTAVGFHYASFDQTTDREVIDLLQAARDFGGEQNSD